MFSFLSVWGIILLGCLGIRVVVAAEKNADTMILDYGYPLERHVNIVTRDGYLLDMQRIPNGKEVQDTNSTEPDRKPVVFLMHGFLGSAEHWIGPGPEKSLALILADAGYDVWLGNARGTTHSRKHLRYNPDTNSRYWEFSWHEIGVYDLPAMIKYILSRTGAEQIHYVGHSQGTTSFFVMASERPEFNSKIRLMVALSPVAYMAHLKNPYLRALSTIENPLSFVLDTLSMKELLPYNLAMSTVTESLCNAQAMFQEICTNSLFLIAGFDSVSLNRTALPVLLTGTPAGASYNQLAHFTQNFKSGSFRKFDYGPFLNLDRYGSIFPPKYKLNRITAPVGLFYAKNDLLVAIEDVKKLKSQLPNVVYSYLVPYKYFNHLDFLWANDAREVLYDRVVDLMERY